LAITANGTAVSNILSAQVHRNNFLAADQFSLVLAVGNNSLGWMQADVLEINLKVAQDVGYFRSLIIGLVDEVAVDLAKGTIALRGRDYTAAFIETKTSEKFQNLTSSQVVTILASRHGFSAQVTPTTTPTGKYYDIDHAAVTNEISEWTLLTYLAEREGFDIFFEGATLYFQPVADPSAETPFNIYLTVGGALPISNVERLTLHRNLTLSRDVVVKVISWNHEMKLPIAVIRRAQKVKGGKSGSSPPTTYIFREPGLSQSQAEAFAETKLIELTQHERRIEFDIPGDPSLTPRSMVRLSGTLTDFDQDYFVSYLTVNFTLDRGFTMHVAAKNASPHKVVFS
jgi:phage protein D